MTISNRYKNTLNNIINKSNLEFIPELIDKKLCNAPRFRSNLTDLLEKNYFNKNVLASDKSSQQVSKIRNFKLYQYYDITLFGLKNRRTQYRKGQKKEKPIEKIR